MFYNEHPPPHFHARYGEQKAIIAIEDGGVLEGSLSRRTYNLVREWWGLHREELTADWELARHRAALNPIAPLE